MADVSETFWKTLETVCPPASGSPSGTISPGVALVVGLVVGFLGGFFFYWFMNRRHVEGLKLQEKLLDRQKADLEGKTRGLPVEKTLESRRLLELAKEDREQINVAIRLYGCKVRWNPEKDSDRVYFELKIFNGSSYPVQFDGIEGFVTYGGEKIWGKVDFFTVRRPLERFLPRGAYTIEVVLLLPNSVVQEVRQDCEKKSFPYFGLNTLSIKIIDGDGLSRITPQSLAFDGMGSINLQQQLK